jgi:hypothetical protein
MAFFDNFTNPLEGYNIWGTRLPDYLTGTPASGDTPAVKGILTPEQATKLKNQSLFQGGLGAIATYLSQPKNQGYGSALPYLGKAFLGGMSASEGAAEKAISNLKTQRELQQFALKQQAMNRIIEDPRVKNDPVLRGLAEAGEYDKISSMLSPTTDMKNYEEAKKGGFKGSFLQYQQTVDPFKAAMYEWTTGQSLPGLGGGKNMTGTPIRGQGGMNQLITVTDPNGVAHQFPNQAAADAFKRRAGITN